MKALITKLLKKEKTEPKVEKQERKIAEKENERNEEPTGLARHLSLGESDQEEEQEIVNSLIKMSDHLKITKINRQLQGEYLTLCHINHILCEDIISVREIKLFLRSKSGQTVQFQRETFFQKSSSKQNQSANHKNAVQYYTLYSNGLIFQFYSIRALLWKVSLRYLPCYKNKWISLMEGSLLQYQQYVREHIVEIVVKKRKRKEGIWENNEKLIEKEEKKTASDHPLNSLKDSKWKTFFEDTDLWNLIQKDTLRTKPNCKFFQFEFDIELCYDDVLQKYNITKSEFHLSKLKDKKKTYYHDCLTRIIYIFLKRHPEITYCQGMNELAALIFYCFANKNSEYFRRVAQSDAFFCFEIVMKDLWRHTPNGFLNGEKYSHRFQELLKKIDLRLYETLVEKNPQNLNHLKILSIKWFNSLFLGEFQIDQSLVFWDCFISLIPLDSQPCESNISLSNLLLSLGLAIIHLNRNALAQGQNPMLLFSKIPNSPECIIEKALSLFKIFQQFF